MLITVPQSLMIWPPGYGGAPEMLTFGLDAPGLSGLGQDDDSGSVDLSAGLTYTGDTGSSVDLSMPDITGTYTAPSSTDLTGSNPDILSSALPTGATSTSSSSSSSTTAQDIAALGPVLAAASKAIATATGPYAIPGTNYIYNPATGQILMGGVPVGTYNSLTGTASALSAGISAYLPLLIGVAAIVGIVMLMGGKK